VPQFYDFPHADWSAAIVDAVSTGMLSESILNDRVADVLRVKMMLGLFDDPYSGALLPLTVVSCWALSTFSLTSWCIRVVVPLRTAPSLVPTVVNSKKHQELALEAARKAITLLKNDHNTLPLEKVPNCIPFLPVCAKLCLMHGICGTHQRPRLDPSLSLDPARISSSLETTLVAV